MRRKYNLPPQSEENEESFSHYTRFIKRSTTAFIGLGLACSILSFIGTYYLFKPDHSNTHSPKNTPSDPAPHVVIDRFDRYPEPKHTNKPDLSTSTQDSTITAIDTKHIVSLPKKTREKPPRIFNLLPDYQSLLISVYYPSLPISLNPEQQTNVNQIYATGFHLSASGELEKTVQGENTLKRASTDLSDVFISLESNISHEQFHQWISSPSKRNRTIKELVIMAKTYKLRGVHIDLNQVQPQDQELFTAFIQQLSHELHSNQKKLSISLHAFINSQNKVESSPAENWLQLSSHADQFIVKPVYMYHKNSYSINWFDEVLKFTKKQIAPSKINVHIPTHAYIKGADHWEKVPPEQVQTLLQTKSDTHRQANGDLIATVNVKGTKQPVIYQDKVGISHKLQTIKAKHPDIAGVISEDNHIKALPLIEQEFKRTKKVKNNKIEKK